MIGGRFSWKTFRIFLHIFLLSFLDLFWYKTFGNYRILSLWSNKGSSFQTIISIFSHLFGSHNTLLLILSRPDFCYATVSLVTILICTTDLIFIHYIDFYWSPVDGAIYVEVNTAFYISIQITYFLSLLATIIENFTCVRHG